MVTTWLSEKEVWLSEPFTVLAYVGPLKGPEAVNAVVAGMVFAAE